MQIWFTLPFIYWFSFRSSITNATKCIPELSANGSEAFNQGLYSPMLSGLRPVRLCKSNLPTELVTELNKNVAANHSCLGWTYSDFLYDCLWLMTAIASHSDRILTEIVLSYKCLWIYNQDPLILLVYTIYMDTYKIYTMICRQMRAFT